MNLTLNEQPECHLHNKIFLFWSFSRNYSKSIRVQMNQRYKIMWNNTVFPLFYLSLESICGIQNQLLQTTRQVPGFTRCVPWLSDPPWSQSLILGQPVLASSLKRAGEHLCKRKTASAAHYKLKIQNPSACWRARAGGSCPRTPALPQPRFLLIRTGPAAWSSYRKHVVTARTWFSFHSSMFNSSPRLHPPKIILKKRELPSLILH